MAEEFEDPTLLVGSDADKELSRARKVMGAAWVAEVSLVVELTHVLRVYTQLLFRLSKGVTSYYN